MSNVATRTKDATEYLRLARKAEKDGNPRYAARLLKSLARDLVADAARLERWADYSDLQSSVDAVDRVMSDYRLSARSHPRS